MTTKTDADADTQHTLVHKGIVHVFSSEKEMNDYVRGFETKTKYERVLTILGQMKYVSPRRGTRVEGTEGLPDRDNSWESSSSLSVVFVCLLILPPVIWVGWKLIEMTVIARLHVLVP